MEADWLRTYGRDFRADLFGPDPMGARRLRALIEGLPTDAMFWRRVPGWGTAEELAALDVEVGHSVVRVLLAAFSKKGHPIPKPLRIPRPADKPTRAARRKPMTAADFRRIGTVITVPDVTKEVGV